jgi:hypothetical protein
VRDALGYRSRRYAPCPDLEELEPNVARTPQLRGRGRHDRLDQLHHASNQAKGAFPKRQLGPLGGAEEVRDETEVRSLDIGKEQRGTAARYHASMDLSDLEMWIDLRLHRDEVIVTVKAIEKRAEVGEGQVYGSRGLKPPLYAQLSGLVERTF